MKLRGQVRSPADLPPTILGVRLITDWKGPTEGMDVFKEEKKQVQSTTVLLKM